MAQGKKLADLTRLSTLTKEDILLVNDVSNNNAARKITVKQILDLSNIPITISGHIEKPKQKHYVLQDYFAAPAKIVAVNCRLGNSGQCIIHFEVNGQTIPGLQSIVLTTSPTYINITPFDVVIGNDLRLVVDSVNNALDLTFTVIINGES